MQDWFQMRSEGVEAITYINIDKDSAHPTGRVHVTVHNYCQLAIGSWKSVETSVHTRRNRGPGASILPFHTTPNVAYNVQRGNEHTVQ